MPSWAVSAAGTGAEPAAERTATFALKAGVRPARSSRMVASDPQATACLQAGGNTTYRPVPVPGAGSMPVKGKPG